VEAAPTAWCRVEIRKPEPYPSLSANGTKGEDGEAGSRAPHVSKATCDRISLNHTPAKTGVLNFRKNFLLPISPYEIVAAWGISGGFCFRFTDLAV